MSIESVLQGAMVDLSGVDLTLEHIAELTFSLIEAMKNQKEKSLPQKIESIKSSLRTFVLAKISPVPEATLKLLAMIDTHVGKTVTTELKETFLNRIMKSVYGLFWSSGSPVSDCSGSLSTSVIMKKACCTKMSQVEEPVFTAVLSVIEGEVVEAVASSSCCKPKKEKNAEPVATSEPVATTSEPVATTPESVVDVSENSPEPIQPANLSIYK